MIAANFRGDHIIMQGICRGFGFGIAAEPFDSLGCFTPLPDADQLQTGKTPASQLIQLLIGNLIQSSDGALVFFRELIQPDQCALSD